MSASTSVLHSPPPRRPPEGRVQTRSLGSAESPCGLCSPPPRGGLRSPCSPLDGCVKAVDDPVGLIVESWCSPTLVSPAGRQCSVLQLEEKQSAGPVDITNPFLEDEQWDMEAMVLSTIAGELEDEEEEEEEVLDPGYAVECGSPDNVGPFDGWALGFRGAALCDKSSCEDASCAAAHTSTPSGAVLAVAGTASSDVKSDGSRLLDALVVRSDGSRLPTSGSAQDRKEQHLQMASEEGHAAFACRCRIATARGATSCLDRFGKEQFRRWHNETYGVTADGGNAKHLDPANSIHNRMWALKEPLPLAGLGKTCDRDALGRKWQIRDWKLDGHEVCCHVT